MKEVVLALLKEGHALTLNEISAKCGINDIRKAQNILNSLVDELEIYVTRKNKYNIFSSSKMLKGKLLILDNECTVVLDDYEQVYIDKRNILGGKNGDTVAIEITGRHDQNRCGKVVKVKTRDKEKIVGELVIKNNRAYIKPDKDIGVRINYTGSCLNLVDGMKVIVELSNRLDQYTYDCEITEVIGHKDDPNVDMISILKSYNIELDFPQEVEQDIENIPDVVTEQDIIDCLNHGGEDLRDEKTVTIDGDDTKDYDDAITIKKIDQYYDLKVSIANVSQYVKVDSNLFNDAVKRGTSIYIPGANVPMLPRKLSNGVCSLNPGVDRLALTFELLIDETGKMVNFSIYDSIINSKKRMTYREVNQILEDNIMIDGYEDYLEELNIMKELHLLLRKNKIDRGFIDFDISENKIKLDEDGKPIHVDLVVRGVAEKIIEDFMVITGEKASEFLDSLEKDGHIYRVHGEPKMDKIDKLRQYLTLLKCDTTKLKDLTPKNMQELLESVKDRKEYLIIARELLKCMQKAIYSTKNIGHFALCSESTCQVTSPIRRAGDLLNHILIRENIYKINKGSLNTKKLSFLANIASTTERNAASCEIETKKMKMAEYMLDHIDDTYDGIITYINRWGFAVELPNLIEGFVELNSLKDKGYTYDESKFALINVHNHKKYALGDKVSIIVKGANKQEKTIVFEVNDDLHQKVKKLNN